jgi:transitional endoplasmic reticulum ATPase
MPVVTSDDDRVVATVAIAEDGAVDEGGRHPVAIAPLLADRLGVDSGAAVVVTTTTGARATALVAVAGRVEPETVRVEAEYADHLGLQAGERVVLESVRPAQASSVTVAPVAALSVRGGRDAVAEVLAGRPLLSGETFDVTLVGGSLSVPFRVLDTAPDGVVEVDAETTVTIESGPAGVATDGQGPVPSTAVGGYQATVETCRSTLVRPLTTPDAHTLDGVTCTTGVLVTGQSGVGKSHHIRHAAWLANAAVVRLDATRLADMSVDAGMEYLDTVQTRATHQPRALLHVEGLDAFAGDTDRGPKPAVERFAAWLDQTVDQEGVVVAAETRDAAGLAATLTRGDRFGRRVEVPRPDDDDRAAVFEALSRGLQLGNKVNPWVVSERTPGYVPADLVALRARMVEAALDRASAAADSPPTVISSDLETALSEISPSASAATVDVPDVGFDDVGGLPAAKRELVRAVEWPLRYPDALDRLGIDPPGGVLLYGPPGNGKTLLARAVAATTDANFIGVDGPELFDRYVGESERAVRDVFTRARDTAPSVVFFDEVDALSATRAEEGSAAPERVVSQLLTELDGLEGREGVTVLGATNRLDRIDPALLRPGRFDRTVHVDRPAREAREEILRIHAEGRPLQGVDLGELAARTEGFSGSDLAALLREASLAALNTAMADGQTPAEVSTLVVGPEHIETALSRVSADFGAGSNEAPDDGRDGTPNR